MRATVMTRGKARANGYRYFPSTPEDAWWRSYHHQTSFEHPTLLIEAKDGQWHIYAGGIPSERYDSQSTQIRYSCIIDGDSREAEDIRVAQAFVLAWLSNDRRTDLGHGLDKWATEGIVEQWYLPDDAGPHPDDIARALVAAVPPDGGALPAGGTEAAHQPRGVTLVGGLDGEGSRDELSLLVADLLRGMRSGAALVLNLLDFGKWPDPSPALVEIARRNGSDILILDTTSNAPVSAVARPKPDEAVVMADPKVRRRTPIWVTAAVVVALLIVLLTLLVLG